MERLYMPGAPASTLTHRPPVSSSTSGVAGLVPGSGPSTSQAQESSSCLEYKRNRTPGARGIDG